MTDWRDDAECRVEDPELFFPSAAKPLLRTASGRPKQCARAARSLPSA